MHDGHTVLYWEQENLKFLNLPLFWTSDGLVVNNNRGNLHTGDIVTAIGDAALMIWNRSSCNAGKKY